MFTPIEFLKQITFTYFLAPYLSQNYDNINYLNYGFP